jgi:phosphatidate phosphatase APP1
MRVEIVVDDDTTGEATRSLRAWLLDQQDLWGRVEVQETIAAPHRLAGGGLESIFVAVGVSGASAARIRTVGNILVAWLKTRRGTVSLSVTSPSGATLKLTTDVRGLTADAVRGVIDDLANTFSDEHDRTVYPEVPQRTAEDTEDIDIDERETTDPSRPVD